MTEELVPTSDPNVAIEELRDRIEQLQAELAAERAARTGDRDQVTAAAAAAAAVTTEIEQLRAQLAEKEAAAAAARRPRRREGFYYVD